MNWVRIGRVLLYAYVSSLALLALATVAWAVTPRIVGSPQVASLWFAIGGFGVLVLMMLVLAQQNRA